MRRSLSNYCAQAFVMVLLVCVLSGGCSTLSCQVQPQASITYSQDCNITREQSWPDDRLKDAFAVYWALRFTGPIEDAFAFEAPYFQEMVGAKRYGALLRGTLMNVLDEVEVRDLVRESEYLYEVHCAIRFTRPDGGKKQMFYRDLWVYAGDRWYHILRNPILFPRVT